MKCFVFLLLTAVWGMALAEGPKKEAVEATVDASVSGVPYEMSEHEKRFIKYLLGLNEDEVGKTLENDLFSDGTNDKPLSPVLVGFKNHKRKRQHVYLFQFGQRYIAYAWVDKDGAPIPIPDVPSESQDESASHYGVGESVTDVDVLPGQGIYILRGATQEWLKGLKD